MGNSVLDGCGSYSQKLTEISTSVKKRRLMNGENLTNQDIWDIDDNIFQAYQIILSQTRDGISISRAIEYLEKESESSGASVNFKEIAIVASQKAIKEFENRTSASNNLKQSDMVAGSVIGAAIIGDIIINKENVEKGLFEIKNGNVDAAAAMATYERSSVAFKQILAQKENGEITPQENRRVLAWIMREKANDAVVDESHIIEVAKKMGYDILKKDSDEKTIIDEKKLESLYQENIPKDSKTSMRTMKDFRDLNKKIGKEIIEKGTYEKKDSNDIQNRINKMAKSSIDFRLDELIEEFNKMQEKGVSGEKLLKAQEKIKVVSDIVKRDRSTVDERDSFNNKKILNDENKEIVSLSENDSDDELSL